LLASILPGSHNEANIISEGKWNRLQAIPAGRNREQRKKQVVEFMAKKYNM